MKNKILFSILLGIFLINMVSSADFDNVKSYNENEKLITITDNLGFGNEIAHIKLLSEHIESVIKGKDRKIAEIQLTLNEDYKGFFKDMEFYDLKTGKKITKEFNYKLKENIGFDLLPKYELDYCDIYDEITMPYPICHYIQNGTKKEYNYKWTDIDKDVKKTLLAGDYIIGIFTDVNEGDIVEWIPTLGGVKINEWAIYTEGLKTNLTHIWTLDETSFPLEELISGISNITEGVGSNIVSGILNNGRYLNSSSSEYMIIETNPSLKASFNGTEELSISLWINLKNNVKTPFIGRGTDNPSAMFGLYDSGDLWFGWYQAGGLAYWVRTNVGNTIPLNEWTHIAVTYNGTWNNVNSVKFYVNGTEITTKTLVYSSMTDGDSNLNFTIGRGSFDTATIYYANASYDEISIWNRVLSNGEIEQLATGLSYEENNVPYFIIIPENQTLIYGENLSVDFVGNDSDGNFDSYSVNDTQFSINSSGTLINSVLLNEGQYGILVTINDTNGLTANALYELTINLSIINNNVSIVYPNESQFSISPTHLDYIFSGTPDECEYSINGGITNNSLNCGENVTGLTANEGENTWLINLIENTEIQTSINSSSDYACSGTTDCNYGVDGNFGTYAQTDTLGNYLLANYTLTNYESGDVIYKFYFYGEEVNFNITCFDNSNNEIFVLENPYNGYLPSLTMNSTTLPSSCIIGDEVKLKITNLGGGDPAFIVDNIFDYSIIQSDITFDNVIFNLETPTPTTEDKGEIYNIMNSVGAGLGLLIEYLAISLPSLLILFIIVAIIVIIGTAIRYVITNFLHKNK